MIARFYCRAREKGRPLSRQQKQVLKFREKQEHADKTKHLPRALHKIYPVTLAPLCMFRSEIGGLLSKSLGLLSPDVDLLTGSELSPEFPEGAREMCC